MTAWPEVKITLRGNSGFCREELMKWCRRGGDRLCAGVSEERQTEGGDRREQEEAAAAYQQTGKAARRFKEFSYQTRDSWSRARRVVAKAEHLEKGANPRFVVTSFGQEIWEARALYEEL